MAKTRQDIDQILSSAKAIFQDRFGRMDYGPFIAVLEEELWLAKKDLVKTILIRNSHLSPIECQYALEAVAPLVTDGVVPSMPPVPPLTIVKGKRGKKTE